MIKHTHNEFDKKGVKLTEQTGSQADRVQSKPTLLTAPPFRGHDDEREYETKSRANMDL
jgi:hypothetical protein